MICPKCGSDKTTSFVDVKENTHGFQCENCHQDFGVDDGKKLHQYEDYLSQLYFRKTEKDGLIREVLVEKISKDDIKLYLTLTQNKVQTKAEPIDFAPYFDSFAQLLFEKLFVLDWNENENGILLEEGNSSYELEIRFRMGLLPTIKKTGTNKFPPYEIGLENLFASLFEEMEPKK